MVRVENAQKKDAQEIASLIMEAMTEECCRNFYGPHHTSTEFHAFLTQLVGMKDSQYSYCNTLAAKNEAGDLLGVAVSYDGAELARLRNAFWKGMLDSFQRDFSNMTDETESGELYLDSFAVRKDCRKQGIGTMLLQATRKKAEKMGIDKVGLLVDDNNPSAMRLYLNFGFKKIGVNSWGGHAMKHLQINSSEKTE